MIRHWWNQRKKNIESSAILKARVSVHWRAHCHAKWLRRCRAFHHSSGIKPHVADSLLLPLTTKPFVHINCWKKKGICLVVFRYLQQIFGVQDSRTWIFQLEYQGQTLYMRILEHNLWSIHLIALDIERSWNIFQVYFEQFLLIAHQAAHQPRKSENW